MKIGVLYLRSGLVNTCIPSFAEVCLLYLSGVASFPTMLLKVSLLVLMSGVAFSPTIVGVMARIGLAGHLLVT